MGSVSGDEDDFDVIFKIVIIGDSSVGKSNLLSRFTANEFNATSKATIGVEFATKKLTMEGECVKAQLWDTAGQEKYRAITSVYYRNSAGAMIVYDITNAETFKNIVDPDNGWLRELKKNTEDSELSGMIIGNKSDLSENRQVDFDEVLDFASNNNLQAMETSALDNTNVDEAFEKLVQEAFRKLKAQKSEEPIDDNTTEVTTTTTTTKLAATSSTAKKKFTTGGAMFGKRTNNIDHDRDQVVSLRSKATDKRDRNKKCC